MIDIFRIVFLIAFIVGVYWMTVFALMLVGAVINAIYEWWVNIK